MIAADWPAPAPYEGAVTGDGEAKGDAAAGGDDAVDEPSSGSQSCHPGGGAGQEGSGCQPGAGTKPSGTGGQPGGGLSR